VRAIEGRDFAAVDRSGLEDFDSFITTPPANGRRGDGDESGGALSGPLVGHAMIELAQEGSSTSPTSTAGRGRAGPRPDTKDPMSDA
jgi:hypothetical protein